MTDKTEVFWTPGDNLSNRTSGLRIEDERMSTTLSPGDIVTIDREVTPRPGDVVAAKLKEKPEMSSLAIDREGAMAVARW